LNRTREGGGVLYSPLQMRRVSWEKGGRKKRPGKFPSARGKEGSWYPNCSYGEEWRNEDPLYFVIKKKNVSPSCEKKVSGDAFPRGGGRGGHLTVDVATCQRKKKWENGATGLLALKSKGKERKKRRLFLFV